MEFWINVLSNLIGDLIGAGVGALGGAYLGFRWGVKKDRQFDEMRRIRLLTDIRGELEKNKDQLKGRGWRMITDVWDSGISSGLIQLLDSDKLRLFSDLYHAIKGNHYEAVICRQAGEEFRSIPPSEIERHSTASRRWEQLSKMLKKREENLKKCIERELESEEKWQWENKLHAKNQR